MAIGRPNFIKMGKEKDHSVQVKLLCMGLHLANLTRLASLTYEILMAGSGDWEPLLNSMTRVIVNGRL